MLIDTNVTKKKKKKEKEKVNQVKGLQLLILFCLQIDLINHVSFSEFTGVFLFIHDYIWLQVYNFYIYLLLFCTPGTHNSHCLRYVYCVNVQFHSKKGQASCFHRHEESNKTLTVSPEKKLL